MGGGGRREGNFLNLADIHNIMTKVRHRKEVIPSTSGRREIHRTGALEGTYGDQLPFAESSTSDEKNSLAVQ